VVGVRLGLGSEQLVQAALDKTRADLIALHLGQTQQVLQQMQVARHAVQAELAQRAVGAAQGGRVVGRSGDQLGQQRVVAGADRVTGVAVAVHAQTRAAGWLVSAEGADSRARAAVGVQGFQVDA